MMHSNCCQSTPHGARIAQYVGHACMSMVIGANHDNDMIIMPIMDVLCVAG